MRFALHTQYFAGYPFHPDTNTTSHICRPTKGGGTKIELSDAWSFTEAGIPDRRVLLVRWMARFVR